MNENWINELLSEEIDDNTEFKKLTVAINNSNLSTENKIDFRHFLNDYKLKQIQIANLEERLAASYHDKTIENYLNEIVSFNPKLGYVAIDAGFSGLDERNEFSSYIQIPVRYNPDTKQYFQDAQKIEERIKSVLRILISDAKKTKDG